MFRLVFVILCAALVQGSTIPEFLPKPRLDGRIVGGVVADIKDIPFQVSLHKYGSHFCGGTFLSKHFVMTAAHCTSGSSAGDLSVRAESSINNSGGTMIKVKKIHQHKQYNPTAIDYDFSILELEDWITTDVFAVASLPQHEEDVDDGTKLRASGWGNTQTNEPRNILRAVFLPKFNQKACAKAYALTKGITDRMMCAGYHEGGKDSCQGDSGGPLTHGNKLVGVVSWGRGCAVSGYPGVYARVSSVRNWVKEVTNI